MARRRSGSSRAVAARLRPYPVLAAAASALAMGMFTTSCGETAGPSLTVQVNDREARTPTSTAANAVNLCCCRVNGSVTNTSTVAVHVAVRWEAVDRQGATLPGQANAFVEDIPPGGTRRLDANNVVPFIHPCATIADHRIIRTDIVGLWMPDR